MVTYWALMVSGEPKYNNCLDATNVHHDPKLLTIDEKALAKKTLCQWALSNKTVATFAYATSCFLPIPRPQIGVLAFRILMFEELSCYHRF